MGNLNSLQTMITDKIQEYKEMGGDMNIIIENVAGLGLNMNLAENNFNMHLHTQIQNLNQIRYLNWWKR